MKKIISTVLFIFLFASANANIFTDLIDGITNNKAEIAEATILTAIAGSAYYYEIKDNDFKVFKKIEKLIKENPKVGTTVLATITTAVGLTADAILRRCNSFVYNVLTNYVIDDAIEHKGEVAVATILTALIASAYYYEIKYNDFKVFKKFEELIKENPKAGASILAIITANFGLTTDAILKGDDSLVSYFLYDAFDNRSNYSIDDSND